MRCGSSQLLGDQAGEVAAPLVGAHEDLVRPARPASSASRPARSCEPAAPSVAGERALAHGMGDALAGEADVVDDRGEPAGRVAARAAARSRMNSVIVGASRRAAIASLLLDCGSFHAGSSAARRRAARSCSRASVSSVRKAPPIRAAPAASSGVSGSPRCGSGGRPAEILARGPARGRHDGEQARGLGRGAARWRNPRRRRSLRGAEAQRRQREVVDVGRRLLRRHDVAAGDDREALVRVAAQLGVEQRRDVGGGGGRGDPERAGPPRVASLSSRATPGRSGEPPPAIELGVDARSSRGAARARWRAAGRAPRAGPRRVSKIVREALLAAGDAQQLRVLRRGSSPRRRRELEERGVERLAVRFLGVGERAVDVEDQCGEAIGSIGCRPFRGRAQTGLAAVDDHRRALRLAAACRSRPGARGCRGAPCGRPPPRRAPCSTLGLAEHRQLPHVPVRAGRRAAARCARSPASSRCATR